jgi:hypothetical protein
MQTKIQASDSHDALNHPSAETWMEFLYGELPSSQHDELTLHLNQCPQCAKRVKAWRQSTQALDAWTLTRPRRLRTAWPAAIKWAAAAMIVGLGVAWGRMASVQAREIDGLRAEVARLSAELPRQHDENLRRVAAAATEAVAAETARLLSEIAKATEEQRAIDQQSLAAALKRIDARFDVLRGQIETVAINTETTFAQTHQDLTRLAALGLPANGTPTRPAGND